MNNRLLLLCLTIFFIAGSVYSQERESDFQSGPAEPESTDIILPPMYLEIEDLSVENINAVIPDEDEVYYSSLDTPLPQLDDIELPYEAFAVTGSPDSFSGVKPADSEPVSFFSEGMIGFGSALDVTGDITLYKIGDQPNFMLRYFHDGYDGTWGHSPGQGYSYRQELIEAEIEYAEGKTDLYGYFQYTETETGLQGNADYYSMTQRVPELSSTAEYRIIDWLRLEGRLDSSYAGLFLNGTSPLDYGVYLIDPSVGLRVGNNSIWSELGLEYNITGTSESDMLSGADLPVVQDFSVTLDFGSDFGDVISIKGGLDYLLHDFTDSYWPFYLSVDGLGGDFLEYSAGGGYRAETLNYAEFSTEYPFASGPLSDIMIGELPITTGWFADAGLRWKLTGNLTAGASAGFEMLKNSPYPGSSSISGFNSITTADLTLLDLNLEMNWRMSDNLLFESAWAAQLLNDVDPYKPRHMITAGFDLEDDNSDKGLSFTAGVSIYDESQSWYETNWMPELSLEGYLRLTEGVLLSAGFDDIAGNLFDSARLSWNTFEAKGASALLKLKISL